MMKKEAQQSSTGTSHQRGMIVMDGDFITRAQIKRNEYLFKTEELFVINRNRWFADFQSHFQNACVKIRKMLDASALSTISYLEYLMLYTNFINRRYVADVFVFGDKSYLDKSQCCIGEYDISFFFVYFDKLWDDLILLKKRYLGKVSAHDVTAFMLETLPDFYSYLNVIARFALLECADNSSLTDIVKNDRFMVNVGEYMVKVETVYEEKRKKDKKKLVDWFNERIYSKYIFGDYSNIDFSGEVFSYTDLRFARFNNSTLNNTTFEHASLTGVNFRGAYMEKCRLDFCSIQQADFTNAMLMNASFKNARAKAGLTNVEKWEFAGFLPTSFRNADLTGADFTGANLTSADFSGAVLIGADFTDAILDKAIFDGCIGKEG